MPPDERPTHGPWVDVHAHPGCGFLHGVAATNPFAALSGSLQPDERVPSAAAGEVATVNVSTVADLAVLDITDRGPRAIRSFEPGEAVSDHRRQLQAVAAVLTRDDVMSVRSAADITTAHESGLSGAFLGCEGADFLDGDGTGLRDAYDDGVRVITLVHYRVNELGDIQTEDEVHHGLTSFGRAVVGEMNRLGIIVDLAHASFTTTAAALDQSRAPAMISHSHLASPGADHPRLLSPEHARLVADAGGIVGAWPSGVRCETLDDFVEEICRLIDVIGPDHVAIGTDLDGNYRPVLTSYAQFPDVAVKLAERGLDSGEIDKVLGGNFIRVFERVEAVADPNR